MARIEDERNRILGSLGEDTIGILRGYGIDADEVLTSALINKFAKEAYLTRKEPLLDLKDLPIEDLLTSELSILLDGESPTYREELERRLNLLGLTEEQTQVFIETDQEAIGKKDPHIRSEGVGVNYYILEGVTVETLPTPDTCLSSELVAIIDDANAAIARDHHWLSDKTFAAAAHVAGWLSGESLYQDELTRRFASLGLGREHVGLFIRNECLILEREKWGMEPSQMSWDSANFPKQS